MKDIRRILRLLALLLLVGVNGCAVNASKRSGVANREIKVLSYNIHHANPPSRPGFIDLEAIAKVIQSSQADLVGLQEVDNGTVRSGNINQAKQLADRLGYHYRYFKAISHDGGAYGLAILSRLPIDTAALIRLPQVETAEKRILACIEVTIGKTPMIFATTHLDATRGHANRQVQIDHIVDYFKSEKKPVILCGDLNASPESGVIASLDKAFVRSCMQDCGHTVPQLNPRRTIDYIAFKNTDWSIVSHEVMDETYASDHRPVKAIFRVK